MLQTQAHGPQYLLAESQHSKGVTDTKARDLRNELRMVTEGDQNSSCRQPTRYSGSRGINPTPSAFLGLENIFSRVITM